MTEALESIIIEAPIDQVVQVVRDYAAYPEFLSEMQSVEVLSRHDEVVVARFDLELMMRFAYTLRIVEDPPEWFRWTLTESSVMLENTGSWQLKSLDDKRTEAIYSLDVRFKGRLPKSVSDRLLASQLPKTLQAFKEKIESLTSN